jgi:hypothetical protein
MAAESKQKLAGKVYIYKKCKPCGIKLHVLARSCWKCGKHTEDMAYGSDNSEDAIYNREVNDVKKCLNCRNTKDGKTCKYAICFGTGRGRCELCNMYENMRFMCCQELQKKLNPSMQGKL